MSSCALLSSSLSSSKTETLALGQMLLLKEIQWALLWNLLIFVTTLASFQYKLVLEFMHFPFGKQILFSSLFLLSVSSSFLLFLLHPSLLSFLPLPYFFPFSPLNYFSLPSSLNYSLPSFFYHTYWSWYSELGTGYVLSLWTWECLWDLRVPGRSAQLWLQRLLDFFFAVKLRILLGNTASGGKVFTRNLAAKFPCQSQMEHTIFYGPQERAFLHLFERF